MAVVVSAPSRPAWAERLPDFGEHLRRWWPAWLLTALLGFLALYPIWMLVVGSLRDQAGAFSVSAYVRMFSSPTTYDLIWTTVWLATVRVALAAVIGIFLAWVVTRTDTPWRGGIEALMWIKFFAPPLPMIVAWTLLGGKSGLLNVWAQQLPFVTGPIVNIYSYGGIIWVSTLSLAAFIFLLTVPAFRAMDASLEESARMLGASRLQALRYVTVPVALPAVLGAIFLAFIIVLESFETEIILGVPSRIYVLSTRIFVLSQEYPQDLPGATALSTFFLLMVGTIILVQTRLLHGKSFVTISGRGYSQQPTPLGRWRWVTFGICLVYFFLAAVLPLMMLLMGSFMKAWGVWSAEPFTLNHWMVSLSDPRLMSAIANTVLMGVLVGVGGTLACALASYLVVRTGFRGKVALEFITLAPRVAPGVVLAIAFAWAYIGLPIFRPIGGTVPMMSILLAISAMPLASRVLNGARYGSQQQG